jgi:hypothetical protein
MPAQKKTTTTKRQFRLHTILMLTVLCAIGAGLGGLLLLFSPTARRLLFNSPLSPVLIRLYNQARPALNLGNDATCLKRLTSEGVQFTRVADRSEEDGCALRYAVQVTQSAIPYNTPRLMTCSLAYALDTFETEIVQPAAQKHLGQPVAKIIHWGTYNCRPMRGQQTLLSEHAYANAIDVAGFQLADGTMLSVKNDWKNAGAKTAFLHEIARRACGIFRNVLTPNYNDLHHDHLHLDQGLWGQCGY